MSSTYLSLYYHLIFSTKNRVPFIKDSFRSSLWEYLGGCVKTMGGFPVIIGGTTDHVHLLIEIKATHRLCDVVRDVKKPSSLWVHTTLGMKQFAWQDGYGAFTVGYRQRSEVISYIQDQLIHHQKRTFQEEFLKFLEDHGIVFDPKYLW